MKHYDERPTRTATDNAWSGIVRDGQQCPVEVPTITAGKPPLADPERKPGDPMCQLEYFDKFETVLGRMLDTTKKKNSDYAGFLDAFRNFRMIEIMTNGRISMQDGLLVRLTDKIARIANLGNKRPEVVSESRKDTFLDAAVYSVIGLLMEEDASR